MNFQISEPHRNRGRRSDLIINSAINYKRNKNKYNQSKQYKSTTVGVSCYIVISHLEFIYNIKIYINSIYIYIILLGSQAFELIICVHKLLNAVHSRSFVINKVLEEDSSVVFRAERFCHVLKPTPSRIKKLV